jgi:hypothetical protein
VGTASLSPSSTSILVESESNSGLSKGAIAGIAIGALVGAAALAIIGLLLYRHQPNSSPGNTSVLAQTGEQKAEIAETAVQEIPSARLKYPGDEPMSGRLSGYQK